MIKQHDLVCALERGRDEAPHVLIAAEPVREEHRLRARPRHPDIVPLYDAHLSTPISRILDLAAIPLTLTPCHGKRQPTDLLRRPVCSRTVAAAPPLSYR